MWLIIAHANDEEAMWLFLGLKRKGFESLLYVLPEELLWHAEHTHRVGPEGASSFIRLRDGTILRDDDIKGVINRMIEVPDRFISQFAEADGNYALQEWHAYLMSWLFSLPCPVLSPPSAALLCGEAMDQSVWLVQAAQAGFLVSPLREGTQPTQHPAQPLSHRIESALVLNDQVITTTPLTRIFHKKSGQVL